MECVVCCVVLCCVVLCCVVLCCVVLCCVVLCCGVLCVLFLPARRRCAIQNEDPISRSSEAASLLGTSPEQRKRSIPSGTRELV